MERGAKPLQQEEVPALVLVLVEGEKEGVEEVELVLVEPEPEEDQVRKAVEGTRQ